MIDVGHYRRAEALVRQGPSSWRDEQAHHPVVFAQRGFPVRVESSADLLRMLDTMQEGRFTAYQTELGGLTMEEVCEFVSALVDHCRMVARRFHVSRVSLPLDTMMAHFVIALKIRGYSPEGDVLEIGPGCGYVGHFMKRLRYDQVETTESFYLLQAMVNDWIFPGGVVEHAALCIPDPRALSVQVHQITKTCHHFPWWKIPEIAGPYDVVTANACLREVTDVALVQYADLIARVLKPDGALIVQCFGDGPTHARQVIEIFAQRGLIPVLATDAQTIVDKHWAVPNALWVRDTHPIMQGKAEHHVMQDPEDELTRRVYGIGPGERKIYTPQEVVGRVAVRV